MNFDYTPLFQPVPYKELFGYLKKLPSAQKRSVLLALGIVTLLVIAGLVAVPFTIMSVINGSADNFETNFVWVLGGIIALAAPFMYLSSQQEDIRIKRFALLNNLAYYKGPLFSDGNGLIFQHGDSKGFEYLFSVQGSRSRIQEFGLYSYTTGSGKNTQTHEYSYVRVRLPRKLPNMVLDSKDNNIFGQSGLPTAFTKDQVLELEGDFNTYFTLYAPKEYERDALYIFTPDVMQAIIDTPNRYDAEIVDNDFYLYTTRIAMRDSAALEELLSIANILAEQLGKQASKYSDERVEKSSRGEVVSLQGARLRVSMVWPVIIAVTTVIVFIAIQVLSHRET